MVELGLTPELVKDSALPPSLGDSTTLPVLSTQALNTNVAPFPQLVRNCFSPFL
jgi:hypothetical protein